MRSIQQDGQIGLCCRKIVMLGSGRCSSSPRRFVGDNYIDPRWMRRLLADRVLKDNVFVMKKLDRFYFILYHALIQKSPFTKDYKTHLLRMATSDKERNGLTDRPDQCNLLSQFMDDNGYRTPKPADKTVTYASPAMGLTLLDPPPRPWDALLLSRRPYFGSGR